MSDTFDGTFLASEVTPQSPGNYLFELPGSSEYYSALDPAQLTCIAYRNTQDVSIDRDDTFYLSQQDGQAAFITSLSVVFNVLNGVPTVSGVGSISSPPLYCTLDISGSIGPGVQLGVFDMQGSGGPAKRFESYGGDTSDTISAPGIYNIYRWSRAGASHVLLERNSVPVGSTLVRRSGSASIAANDAVETTVSIDWLTHPSAAQLVVHEHSTYAPVDPTRSDDFFYLSERENGVVFKHSLETNSANFLVPHLAGSYMVELWGVTTIPGGGDQVTLLDTKPLNTSLSSSIVFP